MCNTVTLTVAIPAYHIGKIAWLPMESLCGQKDVPVSWELIIAEEQDAKMAGEKFFMGYESRLADVGCVSIKYIPIHHKINLAKKWGIIGRSASPESLVFVPLGGDDYAPPGRLSRAHQALSTGEYTWYQCHNGYFYDRRTQRIIMYDHELLGENSAQKSAVYWATLTKYIATLPEYKRERGVDGFIFKHVGKGLVFNDTDGLWRHGLFTDGFNTLSVNRYLNFGRVQKVPYRRIGMKLQSIVPPDIVERLLKMR